MREILNCVFCVIGVSWLAASDVGIEPRAPVVENAGFSTVTGAQGSTAKAATKIAVTIGAKNLRSAISVVLKSGAVNEILPLLAPTVEGAHDWPTLETIDPVVKKAAQQCL